MQQFVLFFLFSPIYNNIVFQISALKRKPEVTTAVDKSQLVWRGRIVNFALLAFNFLVLSDHSVTNAQTLDESENMLMLRMLRVTQVLEEQIVFKIYIGHSRRILTLSRV